MKEHRLKEIKRGRLHGEGKRQNELFCTMLSILVVAIIVCNNTVAMASTKNDFWLWGQRAMDSGDGAMTVYYKGNYMYIGGYLRKGKKLYADTKLKKVKVKKYKISSKCKVLSDIGVYPFERIGWKEGEKWTGYIEIHIKNSKVVSVSWGA